MLNINQFRSGNLHRVDGAGRAGYRYQSSSLQPWFLAYYINDKSHRVDGPAFIADPVGDTFKSYYLDNNWLIYGQWLIEVTKWI